MNMPGINPGVQVSGMPKFPEIAQAYAHTFRDQKEMKIDVWLGSHAAQFDMHKKYPPGDAYNPDRFVDPEGFQTAVARPEKLYRVRSSASYPTRTLAEWKLSFSCFRTSRLAVRLVALAGQGCAPSATSPSRAHWTSRCKNIKRRK
jgi:hypothetical protein